MEGPQEVEEQEHHEEVEGVVVEDGERGSLAVCHLRLLPRDPVREREQEFHHSTGNSSTL